MKYRYNVFLAALSTAAICSFSAMAQDESVYLDPYEYTDNVTEGDYIDLWAYKDTLNNAGMLERTGLTVTTSRINSDGSTEVVVDGGDHNGGDVAGGKRGQSVTSTQVTINDGKIYRVIGGNYVLGYVEGDRNIVINGGNVTYIYGGDWYVENNRPDSYNHEALNKYVNAYYSEETYGEQSSEGVWTPKKSDGDINITVTGGNVAQIRGGHNCADNVVPTSNELGWSLDENGEPTSLRPYSVGGDVNIVLEGGIVGGQGEADAIRGAGGSSCSVDGNVNITVKGEAVVKGNIYAGARNVYGQVGGTNITIEGGEVAGNIYAGGSYSKASTCNLGDARIVLAGGKVTGNIYAAGDRDIINGNTYVTILNKGTQLSEGSIVSGGGINGASVNGTRNLQIGEAEAAAECSLTIADFDTLTISSGSVATLSASEAFTLDNLTLLTTTSAVEHAIELNLNGINIDKLTIAIQLASENTEISDYTLTLTGEGLEPTVLATEIIFMDAIGNKLTGTNVQLSRESIVNGARYSISATIPEPGTATLSLLALAGLAARRRRK